MEFKDKLKALRQEKGLTQAQLAEKLFVSRSTVAKWENGLGLPNSESMQLLAEQFGVTQDAMATAEPEVVIVEKNRRLHLIGQVALWTVIVGLVVAMSMLPMALHSGKYGFTPHMAAGSLADHPYIDAGNYRVYYSLFEGDWEDGRHWSDLAYFRVVEKHFWGCTLYDHDATKQIITHNNYVVGRLYSFQGRDGYYHILHKAKVYKTDAPEGPLLWDIPAELITATAVTIDGVEYQLDAGFFFITNEPVEYFKIGGQWYNIE